MEEEEEEVPLILLQFTQGKNLHRGKVPEARLSASLCDRADRNSFSGRGAVEGRARAEGELEEEKEMGAA